MSAQRHDAGSFAGSRRTGRIREDLPRRVFGWFVLTVGTFVLVQQLPAGPRGSAWLRIVIAGAVAAASVVILAAWRHPRAKMVS
ncbi:hypothetical protein [Cryptosporangium minutisporangium]|uniref:hypothetical protein n=1 Tax=Cryptosporangium minutisporangium TaxID=113569 RepID=UPI0031F16F60